MAATPAEVDSHPLKAALWMTGAVVSFTSMAVAGRYTAHELDTFELLMYRSLVGVVIVLSVALARGTWRQITLRRLPLHFLRNLAHFTGQNLWFFAITLIPLAQVFALEFTTPLWVVLLAPMLLGEHLTRTKGLSVLMGFVGILIVARPDFANLNVGVVAAASCAIGFAITSISTKRLTRTETVTCILFWLTTMQAVMGLVTAGWDGYIAVPSASVAPWVAVVALGGLMAHFSLTKALALAPASIVQPMDFARLPVVAVVGMLVFAEPLDPMVFLGAALILTGNVLNLRAETRRQP